MLDRIVDFIYDHRIILLVMVLAFAVISIFAVEYCEARMMNELYEMAFNDMMEVMEEVR